MDTLINVLITLVNTAILGINIKLYSESVKTKELRDLNAKGKR